MRATAAVGILALLAAPAADAAVDALAPSGEDTKVTPDHPSVRWGRIDRWLRSGPGEIFLQFRLPKIAGGSRIRSATLAGRIYEGSGQHAIARVDDDAGVAAWFTWDSRPVADAPPLAVIDAGSWDAVDLTDVARAEQLGDGVLSLRIAPVADSGATAVFEARGEFSSEGFHLDLDVDPAPRIETGDILLANEIGGVIAIDPATQLRKPIVEPLRVGWVSDAALDPRDGSLVLLETGSANRSIVRLDVATGNLTRIATELAPGCGWPDRLAVGHDGSIFVNTRCSGRAVLLRLDPTSGVQTQVSGDGLLPGHGPIAVAPDGSLVTSNRGELLRVEVATGAQTRLGSADPFDDAIDLAVSADAFWILQAWGGSFPALVRIDAATGEASAGSGRQNEMARAVTMPDGRLWMVSQGASTWNPWDPGAEVEVGNFDPVTGSYTAVTRKSRVGIGGLVRKPDGSLLLVVNEPQRGATVIQFDPASGEETTVAAPLALEPWLAPPDLALDAKRRLLILSGRHLLRVDPETGTQTTVAADLGGAQMPLHATQSAQFLRDVDGRLLLSQRTETGTRILELDAHDALHLVVETPLALDVVIAGGADSFFGADTWSTPGHGEVARIWRIDRATGAPVLVSNGGWLSSVGALLLDRGGDLFVADRHFSGLVQIDPTTGEQFLVVGSYFGAFASFEWPIRLLSSASGLLYSRGWSTIQSYDPATDQVTTLLSDPDLFGTAATVVAPRCADGWDNDSDGAADFPADSSCTSPAQDREAPMRCGLGAELAIVMGAFIYATRRRGGPRGTRYPARP